MFWFLPLGRKEEEHSDKGEMQRASGTRAGGTVYQGLRGSSRIFLSSTSSFTSSSFSLSSTTYELTFKRFATKKTGGASKNGRDSNPKFRFIKRRNGTKVNPGDILATQTGFRWHPGWNVITGKNGTLHAATSGCVWIEPELPELNPKFKRTLIHVLPEEEVAHRFRLMQSNFSQFYTM